MKSFQTAAAALVLLLLSAAPASALAVNAGANATVKAENGAVSAAASANVQARITKGKDRADQEIDRRVNALNVLNSRIQAMEKLAVDAKATISASIQSQISTLGTLKTKIDADRDIATLKTDIQSITKSYRIFLLVIPQGRILVASDKLKFVAQNGIALATKISTRIDAASAAGKDVTQVKTMLTELQAKLSDVSVQADAAATLVAGLTPDNGDESKATANSQALKDARAKIKAGNEDIEAARKEAHAIVKALLELHIDAEASSTMTQ